MFKKKNNQLKESDELCEKNYEAFDLLADRIKENIIYIENELGKAIEEKAELNISAFSMYLGNLTNLKDTLDYELLRYGSDESTKDMKIYDSLKWFIYHCRILVANNNFEFNGSIFRQRLNESKGITRNELKRYIYNSLDK